MKTTIIIMLCAMMVLQGCYSYFTFKPENTRDQIPSSDNSILLHTKDGQSIELAPYAFVEVREPSNFYFGQGLRALRDSNRYVVFHGAFNPVRQLGDYIPCPECASKMSGFRISAFSLSDSSRLRMDRYFIVDSAEGVGIFIDAGTWHDGSFLPATRRIAFDDLQSVEVNKLSIAKTMLLGVPCGFMAIMCIFTMFWSAANPGKSAWL